MMDPSFWVQFLTFACAGGDLIDLNDEVVIQMMNLAFKMMGLYKIGSGLVIINNIAQINIARGGDPKLKDVFVSLISIFNCAGRMAWGLISDWFLSNYGIPRPFFFGIVSGVLCGVHIMLFLIDEIWVLYIAAILGGSSYG